MINGTNNKTTGFDSEQYMGNKKHMYSQTCEQRPPIGELDRTWPL